MSEQVGAQERGAISACVICGHRAVWHHDQRGCEYHGSAEGRRCQCRRTSDQVVARIVYEAMTKAASPWLDHSAMPHRPPEQPTPDPTAAAQVATDVGGEGSGS